MYGRAVARRRELQMLIGVFAAILLVIAVVAVMSGSSRDAGGVCFADDAPTKFDQGTLSEHQVFDGDDCVEDLQRLP